MGPYTESVESSPPPHTLSITITILNWFLEGTTVNFLDVIYQK